MKYRYLFSAVALLLAVAFVVAAEMKPKAYEMTGPEAVEVMSARDGVFAAQMQMQRAQEAYGAAVQKVHDAHKWPADVAFNGRALKWEKRAADPKPQGAKPGPGPNQNRNHR